MTTHPDEAHLHSGEYSVLSRRWRLSGIRSQAISWIVCGYASRATLFIGLQTLLVSLTRYTAAVFVLPESSDTACETLQTQSPIRSTK